MSIPFQRPAVPANSPHRAAAVRVAATQPAIQLRRVASRHRPESVREMIESVAVAFILAFLFRLFVTEPFVIPTGSMADTLKGRHKDVVCEKCGTQFQVGASDEVDKDTNYLLQRIEHAFCPNCHYLRNVRNDPVFKGDRILVNKFSFDLADPQRWDVVVFKYPMEPKVNYIKRLIGLPREKLLIHWGDIYRQGEDGRVAIQRKPLVKQRELQMVVWDNDHPARDLLARGWPECWQALRRTGGMGPSKYDWEADPGGWHADPEARSFEIKGAASAETDRWLRFQLFVPTMTEWNMALRPGKEPLPPPRPVLVNDMYSYNSRSTTRLEPGQAPYGELSDHLGANWVGDLTLTCTVESRASQGALLLELVESQRRYRCRIDLVTGRAALFYQDDKFARPLTISDEDTLLGESKAATAFSRPGRHTVSFANVDDRLVLWIDGRVVPFEGGGEYEFSRDVDYSLPTEQDLSPVGIAATGGASLRVANLRVDRDIYYTESGDGDPVTAAVSERRAMLSEPSRYAQAHELQRPQTFELRDDEFLVLGDNSPLSWDSRFWGSRRDHPDKDEPPLPTLRPYAVPRKLMIGKAFIVYWPHGVPVPVNGKLLPVSYHFVRAVERDKDHPDRERTVLKATDYPQHLIPFRPYFERFGWIH